ncbi:hypothetical protein SAMN05216227_10379 [Pseudorhodobacter antarcticus]|jgi:hypothetical protein|uniref:Uncharacterized protein n=1 Tax=Pseudorhodobacter antarcticus TaxID=1077947 RepID=A0A1H8L090_9RHOB|nr:hypothetical protein [Pseudorhodobacter antarcticus]SEN98544.1 hypothetical protein SAMN05216227_10379 [Pseudorhodobacter antarcticus]
MCRVEHGITSQGGERVSAETQGLRHAREVEGHLTWLDSFTSAALGILAVASGIYTYLGVRGLLDDGGALSLFAAVAYSAAVSTGIFVFWSYLLRLLPAMRTAATRLWLVLAMVIGSAAIVAMSSWLNAAALAGSAAVEQHLARTVQDYQVSLERAHEITLQGQALALDVGRTRQGFEDLSAQEAAGSLSGLAGQGAVFRVLTQKSDELAALEALILAQEGPVLAAFVEGNAILSRMRALTVAPGKVEDRSVEFSEESVRLAGVITTLRQLSVAALVDRAARDLAQSVVLPRLDADNATGQAAQQATIESLLAVLARRAETLQAAAADVLALAPAPEVIYTPISTADAVIRYASNFAPSWAGAIAIDLLPAVLVMIVAVAQAAIRAGREPLRLEDQMTVSELRAAVLALREIEGGEAGKATDPAPNRPLVPDTPKAGT